MFQVVNLILGLKMYISLHILGGKLHVVVYAKIATTSVKVPCKRNNFLLQIIFAAKSVQDFFVKT